MFPRLSGYCKLFFLEKELIEDIIQESFLTLWDRRKTIRVNQPVESLLFTMVRNRCLNELKKRKTENAKIIEVANLKAAELEYLYQIDFSEKEEKNLTEQKSNALQKAVDELPDKMKHVFVQCKIEGKRQQDVAREMGISLKMIEKHLSKAKAKLRRKLVNQYPLLILLISLFF